MIDQKAFLEYNDLTPAEHNEAIELFESVALQCARVSLLLSNEGWKEIEGNCFGEHRIKQEAALQIYKLNKDIWDVYEYFDHTEVEDLLTKCVEALEKIGFDGYPAQYVDYSIYILSQNLWKLELELLSAALIMTLGGVE